MRVKHTTSRSKRRYASAYVDRTRYVSPYAVYNPEFAKVCGDGCMLTKEEEYELWSRDPRRWGPHLWSYMHYAAANYPDKPTPKEIHAMMDWLCALPVTIPCDSCKSHYAKYIERHKPILHDICSSRDSLFKFLVDIHNKVNKRNNKPEMTYDQAVHLFGDMY